MTRFGIDITNQNHRFIKRKLIALLILSTPIWIDLLLPNAINKSSYAVFIGAFFIGSLLNDLGKEIVYNITFDIEKEVIIFLSKSPFSRPKQATLPLKEARLDIMTSKKKQGRELQRIDFMKNKKELAIIRKGNNEYDAETLNAIISTSTALHIPIRMY